MVRWRFETDGLLKLKLPLATQLLATYAKFAGSHVEFAFLISAVIIIICSRLPIC